MRIRRKIAFGTALMSCVCFFVGASEETSSKSVNSSPTKKDSVEGKTIFFGDFLWWQAQANDVPFVTKQTIVNTSANKKNITLNGQWEPGFRVGAGYHFGFYDELDLVLTYTRFYGKSNRGSETANSFDISGAQYLRQNWIPFLGPITLSATGEWNVLLNVGDLEIGRRCNVSKHFWLRPHGGVRLAWVDFKYNANYTGLWIQSDESTATQKTSMSASSYFNSGGIRAGSEAGLDFCRNLSFVADVAASILYGHFKVNESFNGGDTVGVGSLIPVYEDYKGTINGIRVNLDVLLGLKGSVDFYKDRCCFSVFAGYELSEWFRVNELFQIARSFDPNDNATFSTIYSSNDIGFQGLTVRASLAF